MSLTLRGINYDTGTEFVRNDITRKKWVHSEASYDIKTIKNDLHCNAINLYGTCQERLIEAVEIALSHDLVVFAQLRCIDKTKAEMALAISSFAKELNKFEAPENIVLNIGCESSLFTKGFIPGKSFLNRMLNMIWVWPFLPLINKRLSLFLNQIVHDIRPTFPGKIIYGSGSWEEIEWASFDYMGINLYRDKENNRNYETLVRNLASQTKSVIITEFGCCSFDGASRLGGGGWTIVDFKKQPPQLKRVVDRNEIEQANLLCESIELYNNSNLYGSFIYDFVATQQLYSPDPQYDLDRASYGIVKAIRTETEAIRWEKKVAFDRVAEVYERMAKSQSERP